MKKEIFDQNVTITSDKIHNELLYKGNIELEQLNILKDYYSDYQVRVNGSIELPNCSLKEIPVNFISVTGDFNVFNNDLKSLENCPREVGGTFNIASNALIFTKKEIEEHSNVKKYIYVENFNKNLEVLIEKLEKFTNKKVLLEDK